MMGADDGATPTGGGLGSDLGGGSTKPPALDLTRTVASHTDSASGTPPTPQSAPARIGSYAVQGELGRGGMGVVYLAEDSRLKRPIAIKVLPEGVATDPERLGRFEREAQLLASLNHSNIATIHSIEQDGELNFLTLEFIPGVNLSQRIGGAPLPVEDTLSICRQIATALEAAHRKNVVHLDMKPGNVMVTPDGLVKVLDFGLARAIHDSPLERAPGPDDEVSVGTPGYMSPEQLFGLTVDHRADIWALGCILFECLTGTMAFSGETLRERYAAAIEQDPDWTALPPATPKRLRDLCAQCLAKSGAARLSSATEARRALEEEIAWRVMQKQAPAERPPSDAPRNNLPTLITSFIGREQERTRIRERLGQVRLLTLTGMGGCGKTRLAIEVARDLLRDHSGGVWLTELAPLADPQLLPQTVAAAMGLREERDRSLAQTVIDRLRPRKALLLLDNCEHLLLACADFASSLLVACPELRILATSRESLGITGEAVYPLPPLALPDPRRPMKPEELAEVESIQLFIERARAVQPNFALNAETSSATAEICRRLDGIPLAIELAAARIRALSVVEIAKRLDDRFRLLTAGSRTALPRHQTLRALIDWSHESLTVKEQALLRRLSVFAGGWTLDSAEAVCQDEDLEMWEVLDLLTHLVDKSLVEVDAEGGQRTGMSRYRMLETVRQYSRERLVEKVEEEGVRVRHRDFFLALAEGAEPHLIGSAQSAWFARLEAEYDNLRAALTSSKGETELGLRLAGALGHFWKVRGHWSEGRALCAQLESAAGGQRTALHARVLAGAGNLALSQGDLAGAAALHEKSHEIWQELGNLQGISQSRSALGIVAWAQGDKRRARQLQEESLQIQRQLGDLHGIAAGLNNLGNAVDDEEARACHEESLKIKRELGDLHGIAASLSNLGVLAKRRGDYTMARALHEESLSIRRELGDPHGISVSLINLGNVVDEQFDFDQAHALLAESLEIKRELGDRHGIGIAVISLGKVVQRHGDYVLAYSLLSEGLAIHRELGDRQTIALALDYLGRVQVKLGDFELAYRALAESLALNQELGLVGPQTQSLLSLGLLAMAVKEPARAARLFGAAARWREKASLSLSPPDRDELAREEAALRTMLGEEAFAQAWTSGQAMSDGEAIACALTEPYWAAGAARVGAAAPAVISERASAPGAA
jgi:non-specific serine/threonine protein kinase